MLVYTQRVFVAGKVLTRRPELTPSFVHTGAFNVVVAALVARSYGRTFNKMYFIWSRADLFLLGGAGLQF